MIPAGQPIFHGINSAFALEAFHLLTRTKVSLKNRQREHPETAFFA